MADDTKLVIDCSDPTAPPVEVPFTEAEHAQRALDATAEHGRKLGQQQALHEDAERLGVIAERAQTDPAFAALVELTLGGKGV